tara:strand:- start:179 stop:1894 length:1716 start_codon:yes stop_codon:yes gene_type:complete
MRELLFKNKNLLIFFLILIFSLYDRTLWSNISQWQVDEASTMWISLKYPFFEIPVGLISSENIPNPNGMIYFSKLLNKFPSLWLSSYFLSLLQLILICVLGYILSRNNQKLFFFIIIPLILSLCLRSISAHLSNQWVLTLINLLFFILIISYLNKPSINKFAILALPAFLAPSIYLSGISNSIAYLFSSFFIFFFYPSEINFKKILKPFLVIFVMIILFSYFIWYPFLKNLIINDIKLFGYLDQSINLKEFFSIIIGYPYWSIFYAAGDITGTFKHNGLDTISSPFWSIFHYSQQQLRELKIIYDGPLSEISILLLKINSFILIIQSIISYLLLIFYLFFKRFFKVTDKKILFFIFTSHLFIFLVIIFGAILGSPNWVKGERLDMQVHLLPLFFIIWFLTPWIIQFSQSFNKYLKFFTLTLLATFIAVNLCGGYFVYNDHKDYKGNILTDADVPLIQKQEAIEYIVEDWRKNSNDEIIKVGYGFNDKRYSWVNRFGEKYEKYYPGVYVRGREYDYILMRSYNLKNNQEGIQNRSIVDNDYIITYNVSNPPVQKENIILLKEIGRLNIYKLR